MDVPIQINTIRMGFPIHILRGHRLKFSNNYVLQSLKIVFIFANSAGPDEMPRCVAFHLGLHCLPKYPFSSFQYTMGYGFTIKLSSQNFHKHFDSLLYFQLVHN